MASIGNWTVIMEDKKIIKQVGDGAGNAYVINDDSFWSNSSFSNIWAIHYGNAVASDEVEYRDTTPHSTFASTGIDFQPFIDKWDSEHLAQLQANWDNDNSGTENEEGEFVPETESEKIARLGARPTSYSS
tara:strand:- start:3358 stop:3750 length:393 start_codon:yes stop_codon:yes gene_type:complete